MQKGVVRGKLEDKLENLCILVTGSQPNFLNRLGYLQSSYFSTKSDYHCLVFCDLNDCKLLKIVLKKEFLRSLTQLSLIIL